MRQITTNMLGFLLLVLGILVGAAIAYVINKRSENRENENEREQTGDR